MFNNINIIINSITNINTSNTSIFYKISILNISSFNINIFNISIFNINTFNISILSIKYYYSKGVLSNIKVFNFYYIDKIKNLNINKAHKKIT